MSGEAQAVATTQPAQPIPGTPDYDAAMIAKFDNVGVTADPNADAIPPKPEGVPDKFYDPKTGAVDVAGLAKSYTELERARSQKPAAQETTPAPKAPTVDPVKAHADTKAQLQASLDALKANAEAKPEDVAAAEKALADHGDVPKAAEQAVQQAGLDMAALQAEYVEKGELSDESFKKFEAVGITRDMVNTYIAGQQALATQQRADALKDIGGEEQFAKIIEWARSGLSAGEIAAFNKSVTEGNLDAQKLALAGLNARYTAANGNEPRLVNGGTTQGAAPQGYRSVQEMTAAMSDKRYGVDPAYTRDVEQRVAAATAF